MDWGIEPLLSIYQLLVRQNLIRILSSSWMKFILQQWFRYLFKFNGGPIYSALYIYSLFGLNEQKQKKRKEKEKKTFLYRSLFSILSVRVRVFDLILIIFFCLCFCFHSSPSPRIEGELGESTSLFHDFFVLFFGSNFFSHF